MQALFTRTPQHQLERALAKEASPIPLPRRWPALLLVGAAGLAVGMAVGGAHRWVISPITPEPAVVGEKSCGQHFNLPPLDLPSLDPVWTPELRARHDRWFASLSPAEKAEQLQPQPEPSAPTAAEPIEC